MSKLGILGPVIYILTAIVISGNSYAAAILQTTSDAFSFEGGGRFRGLAGAPVISESFHGPIMSDLVGEGSLEFVGVATVPPPSADYDLSETHYGWSRLDYSGSIDSFFMWQRAGQDCLGETYAEYDGYGFVTTEFNWAFKVIEDDAVLSFDLLSGTGTNRLTLYDLATGSFVYSGETTDSEPSISVNNLQLYEGHSYVFQSCMNNQSTSDGREVESFFLFDNATHRVPEASSVLYSFLGFVFLCMLGNRRRLFR